MFDSDEEKYFSWYLDELLQAGFIKSYGHHTEKFMLSPPAGVVMVKKLKTKEKRVSKTLLRGHEYTPDFMIRWNPKALDIFYSPLIDCNPNPFFLASSTFDSVFGCDIGFVEIKAVFSKYNMGREFSINQKWLYAQEGIYVQKVIPTGKSTCLFAKTFTPEKYLLTEKTHKPRKLKWKPRTLTEYLETRGV